MQVKRFILCSLFVLIAAAAGHAQDNSIKCESNDGHRKYCGNYNSGQIVLDRQISGSPCVQGETWGVDRGGLWVDRGCRAFFRVNPSQGDDRRGNDNNGWWDRAPNDTWPPRGDWRGGNWGRGGACFYTDPNFGGRFFCLRRGEQRASLEGYGDKISSIRIFGHARVIVFDDRDFRGAHAGFRNDYPDQRDARNVAGKPGHTWNNRISSLQIQ